MRRRDSGCSRVLPGMSNTKGGRSTRGMWQVEAASGRVAAISSGYLAGQRVEGSLQGLSFCSQRSDLPYGGPSMKRFCLTAQRVTQRSSLDEIAASQ